MLYTLCSMTIPMRLSMLHEHSQSQVLTSNPWNIAQTSKRFFLCSFSETHHIQSRVSGIFQNKFEVCSGGYNVKERRKVILPSYKCKLTYPILILVSYAPMKPGRYFSCPILFDSCTHLFYCSQLHATVNIFSFLPSSLTSAITNIITMNFQARG